MPNPTLLITLFLSLIALTLLPSVSAIPPNGFFRFRHMDKYEPEPSAEPGNRKQTTRDEILTRIRVKETTAQVRDLHRKWKGPGIGFRGQVGGGHPTAPRGDVGSGVNRKRDLRPRASIVVKRRWYACDEGEGTGYARYPGWDLEFDDLPFQPIHTISEYSCVAACTTYGTACAGALYVPDEGGACYLKGTAVSSGIFTDQSEDAQSEGTVLNLVGGCNAWSGIVPEQMEGDCCNN